jgi:hypothetical protein
VFFWWIISEITFNKLVLLMNNIEKTFNRLVLLMNTIWNNLQQFVEGYFRYYSSEEQACWRLFHILFIRRTSLLKVISDIIHQKNKFVEGSFRRTRLLKVISDSIHQKNKFVEGYFRYYSSEEQVCWRLFQILFIRRTSLNIWNNLQQTCSSDE